MSSKYKQIAKVNQILTNLPCSIHMGKRKGPQGKFFEFNSEILKLNLAPKCFWSLKNF